MIMIIKKINKPRGNINNKEITYDNCKDIINNLKFNENSNLFALERNEELKGILGAIYQTFYDKEVYYYRRKSI